MVHTLEPFHAAQCLVQNCPQLIPERRTERSRPERSVIRLPESQQSPTSIIEHNNTSKTYNM